MTDKTSAGSSNPSNGPHGVWCASDCVHRQTAARLDIINGMFPTKETLALEIVRLERDLDFVAGAALNSPEEFRKEIVRLRAGLLRIGATSLSYKPVVDRLLAGESIEQIAARPSDETPAPRRHDRDCDCHDCHYSKKHPQVKPHHAACGCFECAPKKASIETPVQPPQTAAEMDLESACNWLACFADSESPIIRTYVRRLMEKLQPRPGTLAARINSPSDGYALKANERCNYVGMYDGQCGLDAGHTGKHRLFGPHRGESLEVAVQKFDLEQFISLGDQYVLPCDVRVGNGTFKAGLPVSAVSECTLRRKLLSVAVELRRARTLYEN